MNDSTRNGLFIILLFAALAAVAYFLSRQERKYELNNSAVGFSTLSPWLERNDIDSMAFQTFSRVDPGEVGLRVLPLHDVLLSYSSGFNSVIPEEGLPPEEVARIQTERQISRRVVRAKIKRLPTLVVLPKWRRGVRELGLVHPEFLIDELTLMRLGKSILLEEWAGVQSADTPEFTLPTEHGNIALHYPQLFSQTPCEPLLGDQKQALLVHCTSEDGDGFWMLSDPDLLNNHGLSQGENARIAREVIQKLLPEHKKVVVDFTTHLWVPLDDDDERSWEELKRFFAWPFSLIWLCLAALGVLTLWRAWVRGAPAIANIHEESGPGASRDVAIEAKARLLRLSGHDNDLMSGYYHSRFQHLALELLGAQEGRGQAGIDRVLKMIGRRKPELAAELAPYENPVAPGSGERLMADVDTFESLIERTLNEFGRARQKV